MKKLSYSEKVLNYYIDIDKEALKFYLELSKKKYFPSNLKKMWKKLYEDEKLHLKYWNYLKRQNYTLKLFKNENPYLVEFEKILNDLKRSYYLLKKNNLSFQDAFYRTIVSEFKIVVSSPMYKFLFTHDIILEKGVFNPKGDYDKHLGIIIDMGLKIYKKNTIEFSLLDAFKNLHYKNFNLAKETVIDSLTGAKSRRYFFEDLKFLEEFSKRNKRNLAIFVIDIDNFKFINDTYGHQSGDKVLKKVSETISKNIRASDVFARIGGDEFSAVFYNLKNPENLKERIKKDVENLKVFDRGKKIKVSISVGCSIFDPLKSVSISELIKQADKRMYEDKRTKRDKRVL